MSTTPSFSQAEYLDELSVINAPARPDPSLFLRALLFGLGGVIGGAIVDGGFIGLTNINIGFLAIGVAWLVAKAMTIGSRGQGGRSYQITAIILTYLSVSLAHAGLLWWEVKKQQPIPFNLHNLLLLFRFGVESPFLRFEDSAGSAVIGLFILFVGLRAAWRMTSGDPRRCRQPFAR